MNSEVAKQLKTLIEQYGTALYDDPKRCRALLMDYCGDYKKEVHVLVSALENGIPGELLSSQNVPYEVIKTRMVKKLCDDIALAEQAAGWSIDTWAFALKIKDELPDSAGELYEKGKILHSEGKYEESLRCFDKALEINPQDVYAWTFKGNFLYCLGCYKEALHCYDKALEFGPRFEHAWFNKGAALSSLGRYEEALRCVDKVLEINPQNVNAWTFTGLSLNDIGRYEEALRCYDRALEINPQDDFALEYKNSLLSKLGGR